VISSVAGDRGRQSNFLYGAVKAGLSVFSDGLRNRLAQYGVSVVTVKPGFVDTPMTAHLKKEGRCGRVPTGWRAIWSGASVKAVACFTRQGSGGGLCK